VTPRATRWSLFLGGAAVAASMVAWATHEGTLASQGPASAPSAAPTPTATPTPTAASAGSVAPPAAPALSGARRVADPGPLLAQLEREDPGGLRVDAQIDRIVAWLAANPGSAPALAAWIREQNSRYDALAPWPRIALAALGAAGVAEARAVLRALAAGSGLSSALRLHALMHLGRSAGVDASDLDALVALSAQRTPEPGARSSMVATAALSTVGALAQAGRLEDPAARERALSVVRIALEAETDPAYVLAAVQGAAASSEPALLPALEPLSSHGDAEVRAAVASALGQLPGGTDARWALAWASREATARVRAELARAVQSANGAEPSPDWTAWAIESLPTERGTSGRALVALAGAAAAAGSEPARDALLARFKAEQALGGTADTALLRDLGKHLDANTLGAAIAAGSAH
jgi:hypothetical protein